MRLNLGSNDRREPGFLSVDVAQPADIICDLNVLPWPWEDNSVEEVKMFDVIEHLSPTCQPQSLASLRAMSFPRVLIMNELHRVMKPGARVEITTPNAAKGGGYFQDPTHCTPWTLNSWKYFDPRKPEWIRFNRHYGITARFHVIELAETWYQDPPIIPGSASPDPVYKLRILLEAVK